MIYVCVPLHDEARTAGLVLWKVRQVFTAFPREYQLLVLDDASTDGTGGVLASYAKVLPMTIVTHRVRQGYAKSLEELLRLALQRTDRAKRDCAITLHGDFVHSPESMDEMVKRLESGADLVVAELVEARGHPPRALRLVRRWTPWLLRVPGVKDTVSGFLALRLILLRQALKRDDAPLLATDGWCANAELLARLAPHARRVDTIPAAARYDLVQRPSRVKPWRRLLEAWRARAIIRAARVSALTLLLFAAPPLPGLRAQTDTAGRDTTADSVRTAALVPIGAVMPAPRKSPAVRFPVGERLVYGARFGPFSVGGATMEVAGIDTVRGIETVHFVFTISGGALWYHIEQKLESWVGRYDFHSRRFWNQTEEKGKAWERKFDNYPDSGFYREAGHDTTRLTVLGPLDDAAFLYWIRTVPLEIGKRYEYERYFRPERNPVIVEVLKRERVSVAGKKWQAIVIRPRIPHGGGIFAEKADARMWLSDDDRRIMLALQSTFSFGQVTMKLKEYSGAPAERP
jgi:CTP:molybdopterin cytidylyltransferase MocA